MTGVQRKEPTLVQTSALLSPGYRQTQRVWRRYRAPGEAGRVHRPRGRNPPRRKPNAVRAAVLELIAQEHYANFGPTLRAQHLARRHIQVEHETVRRRRQKHRQWRERKACFGQMVPLDRSHHDWFEGRRAPCVLRVRVDEATGRVWAQFFEQEATCASYDVLEGWVKRRGLPQSLDVDRDGIYRCEGKATVAEPLAGKAPQTQFGRAMEHPWRRVGIGVGRRY